MRPGSAGRELDQPQGGRGRVPPPGAARPPLRRRGGRDGLRRGGPGRDRRAQGRDRRARLPAADRRRRVRAPRTSSSTRTSSRSGPGSRSTPTTRSPTSRRPAGSRPSCPACSCRAGSATSASRSAATTGSARRSTRSSCTTRSRAGMDMGIVNAGQLAVYDDIDPELRELVEDVVLNRRPDATERLLSWAASTRPRGRPKAAATDLALARPAGRRAADPCPGRGDRRLDRRGHRGGAADRRPGRSRSSRGR